MCFSKIKRMQRLMFKILASIILVFDGFLLKAQESAQDFSGAIGGLKGIYRSMGNLMIVIIGLAGLIVLVRIIISMMNGDRESAKKLAWWLIGLAFGFTMISVLMNLDLSNWSQK